MTEMLDEPSSDPTDPDEPSTPRWKVIGRPIAASVAVGVLAGVVWAFLAPAEQFVVVQPGRGAALTGESLHRFDSLAVFVCIAFGVGIVLPVAFWAWTRARGPLLSLSLTVGAVAGSGAMLGVGLWIASLLHPRPDDPAVGSVVAVAPGMESLLVLLVQALTTSLVVLVLAAMNPHDNLQFTPEDELADDDSAEGLPVEADRA